ncbi:MAG: FtsX-like permease family protein [Vicinamibacterales bacterium]
MLRLLRWLTGDDLADSIAGDLHEERLRRSARGTAAGTAWYWRTALTMLTAVAAARALAGIRRLASAFNAGGHGRDLRHALRSLRRAPWYAAAVIGVIALSMALATTVFAVVDGVLFKPLPYPRAHELYSLEPGFTERIRGTPSVSLRELDVWRTAMPDVEFTGFDGNRTSGAEAVNQTGLAAAMIGPEFFDVIGVRPMMGGFTPQHFGEVGRVIPIIVSHHVWQQRFAGDPQVLGRRLAVDPRAGGTGEVVGVMPEGFVFPSVEVHAEILLPLLGMAARPTQRSLEVVMRLPAGESALAVRDRLEAVMAADAAGRNLRPDGRRYLGPFDRATLHPLGERMAEGSARVFSGAFLAAALLVLIACLNVSGLMAARSLDRAREIGLRRAIGAGTWHIARSVLIENAVLVASGAGLGLVAAPWLLRVALDVMPGNLLLLKTPVIDWRVAAFALFATTVSVLLVSIWPIRRALGLAAPVAGAAVTSTPRAASVGRRLAVAAQVAVGLVLAVGGSLLVGSVAQAWRNEPGIDPEDLSFVELRIPPDGRHVFGKPAPGVAEELAAFLRRVRSIPGVRAAGAIDAHVLDRSHIENVAFSLSDDTRHHIGLPVTGGFFEAAGLSLIAGRFPADGELDRGAPVIAVSQAAARSFWHDGDAIGRDLYTQAMLPNAKPDPSQPRRAHTVVGIVADVRYNALDVDPYPVVYGSYAALNFETAPVVAIRAPGATGRVLSEVVRLAEASAPALTAVRAQTATDILADTIRPRRFLGWLFGAFGAAALVLVGAGILGVIAMSAARRTREVGIRMALGSTREGVVTALVAGEAATVGAGLVAGVVVAAWLARFLESHLYNVTVYQPTIWFLAVGAVVATAAAGSLIPAVRASRVDPAQVLRAD